MTDPTPIPAVAPAATPPPGVAPAPAVCFGVDVAKDRLDLGRSDADAVVGFANDPAGHAALAAHVKAAVPAGALGTIVLEATGGYEQALLDALLDAGLPVARVNPGRVRAMANALGKLAKTDAVDARVLAHFARLAQPRLAERQSTARTELHALVTCRRQLLKVRTEQSNRRGVTASKPARHAIDAVLRVVDKQVKSLDEQIRKLVDADQDMRDADRLLRSVPGVGHAVSAVLLSELSELGTTDRRKLASLVGLAPFADDSGKRSGNRSIRGGRATVRSGLYMAALTGVRRNPVLKAFYQRLRGRGHSAKQALTACMRKLLALLNAMLRDGLTWDQLSVVLDLPAPTGGGAK